MEPAVCWMFRYPDPSRSGGRGSPGPSARSICAMMAALERGLWPGVAGCLSARTTYDQFSLSPSAMDLALVTFAVEKRIVGPKQAEVQSLGVRRRVAAVRLRILATLSETGPSQCTNLPVSLVR